MSENEKLQSLLHSLHSPYTNHHLHDPQKFPIFINDSYYLCLAEDCKNDGPQKVTLKGRESIEWVVKTRKSTIWLANKGITRLVGFQLVRFPV